MILPEFYSIHQVHNEYIDRQRWKRINLYGNLLAAGFFRANELVSIRVMTIIGIQRIGSEGPVTASELDIQRDGIVLAGAVIGGVGSGGDVTRQVNGVASKDEIFIVPCVAEHNTSDVSARGQIVVSAGAGGACEIQVIGVVGRCVADPVRTSSPCAFGVAIPHKRRRLCSAGEQQRGR